MLPIVPAANSKILQMLPVLAAFTLAALIISAFHLKETSIALTLGVIAGGLSEMDHRTAGRLKNYIFILIGFALTAIFVQIALRLGGAATIFTMTVLAFAMTMLGAIDGRYRTVSFCSLAVAVYILLTYQPNLEWYANPLMIIVGASLMQCCQFLLHLVYPNRPVQEQLMASFLALSDYIHVKARYFSPDERDELEQAERELYMQNRAVTDAFNAARDVLFKRLSSQQLPERSRRQLSDFFAAQDIHERISAAHVDYAALTASLEHTDLPFRIERLISLQARSCREYAAALNREQSYCPAAWLERATQGLQNAYQAYLAAGRMPPDGTARVIDNLSAITARIRTLGTAPDLQDPTLANADISHWREILPRLKNHLTPQSIIYRHAVRMAAVTFLSSLIAEALHLHLGYWILLTAVFIIQPNRAATQAKLTQRIIGTILGVIVGVSLPALAPDRVTLLTLLVISNTLFFYFRSKNYSSSTFFITVQVFISFALVGIGTHSAAAGRIIDTLLGAAIAWIGVSCILPDRRYLNPAAAAKTALASQADYLHLITAQLGKGSRDDISYRIARRSVHEQAAALANLAAELPKNTPAFRQTQQCIQYNYRLIGQLSTLGSLRGHLSPDDAAAAAIAAAAVQLETAMRTGGAVPSGQTLENLSPAAEAITAHLNKAAALTDAIIRLN